MSVGQPVSVLRQTIYSDNGDTFSENPGGQLRSGNLSLFVTFDLNGLN